MRPWGWELAADFPGPSAHQEVGEQTGYSGARSGSISFHLDRWEQPSVFPDGPEVLSF